MDIRVLRDSRGTLTVCEEGVDLPFEIKRLFFITDVPGNAARAGHAHMTTAEILIIASGSCRVRLDDGSDMVSMILERTSGMLFVPKLTWIELDCFAPDTVLVVAASNHYDPVGYIHSYDEFLSEKRRAV